MSSEFLRAELSTFADFGERTRVVSKDFEGTELPHYVNEFWTSKQRAAHSLHEVSYRACFKPQLPGFFIERLTRPGDTVYDPFMGRGTTVLEAALRDRIPLGNDINPLARILVAPRLHPPSLEEIAARLNELDWTAKEPLEEDLLTFYHPETLAEITALRHYLLQKEKLDHLDEWIRMVATNRLTGHSKGFFSVYTLPPNQAVSLASQRKINEKRAQIPPRREVAPIILKKSRSLLLKLEPLLEGHLWKRGREANLHTGAASKTPGIANESVDLVVTSPPFLNVVDYQGDNWLRCWFNGINANEVPISIHRRPDDWQEAMKEVFCELRRVLRSGGHVAFEVGEVNRGKLLMEELVVPAGLAAGLKPELIVINEQNFTKTANCWGVDNLGKGTNTNRIVLFTKP
ncbi:MAG: DNA methyltransferase [Verrucomicrobiota bacterium JB023]|nr:DNA methyltransferase [Verrucomicrobiota bacterium JB023]